MTKLIVNSALDLVASRFKAVRLQGKVKGGKHAANSVGRWVRNRLFGNTTSYGGSIGRAFRRQPIRSTFRLGSQSYGWYRSVRGKNCEFRWRFC